MGLEFFVFGLVWVVRLLVVGFFFKKSGIFYLYNIYVVRVWRVLGSVLGVGDGVVGIDRVFVFMVF